MRLHLPELALLLGTLASPLLPAPWSALALVVLALLWLRQRPPRREVIVVLLALAAALAALGADWTARLRAAARADAWTERTTREYARTWEQLRDDARAAARALAGPADTPEARLAAFRSLAALQPGQREGRRALLLLDPDGVAVAWAGEGLLHELEPEDAPRSGLAYEAAFSAVTLLAVEPLDSSRRPWRAIAGASFPTRELPFEPGVPARWSLLDDPGAAAPGALVVQLTGAPALVVERVPGAPAPRLGLGERLAWAVIAGALLVLAIMRGVGLAMPAGAPPARRERWIWVVVLGLAGVVASGASAAVPVSVLAVLAGGVALAAVAFALPPRPSAGPARVATASAAGGAAAVLALFSAAWLFQQREGPIDLGESVVAGYQVLAMRLGLTATALGLFGLAAGLGAREARDRRAWLAVGLLLAGGALHDLPLAALPVLAAGGAAAASWADLGAMRRRPLALAAAVLVAALAAAGSWETAHRLRLRGVLGNELLPRLAPPSAVATGALANRIDGYFGALDLARVVPRSPAGLERQDLAFALWSGSPLARGDARSALRVVPNGEPASSFSFGLPLTEDGEVDWSPSRWQAAPLPSDQESLLSGEAALTFGGTPWGRLRWWLLPQPGFRARRWQPLDDVEVGLLKGVAGARSIPGLPEPALYASYSRDGRALASPWDEAPPLPSELRLERPGEAVASTPAGRARAWVHPEPGGWEVLYLPSLTPLAAAERAGTFALGTLFLLGAAALAATLLALPRAGFRDVLRRTVRSYSKRLLIVYTLLLLVPLVLLNTILVRTTEERLEQAQRAAGEAALNTAQRVLADYILTFDPGFGLDTTFDDELLSWLSQVARHEVNLYWGSSVYASSRHELFTAGLLPKRIPGEIFQRLSLLGYDLSSRTNRAGDTAYLEIYAPLRIGDEPAGEERLFLSIPLLAQQEEVARELAHLRRRGLLATAALFVLLVAVATRLAQSFTRPLMQLVEGTRRIAGGARSLDLAPTELELAALVRAVDEMARKIAEGRERLVREKQVVERMVENITSGVVSLDRERRVLMHNRVAAEMLGVEVGESLEAAVGGHLEPVAEFLARAGSEIARRTVRLTGDQGEREWSLAWVPVPGEGEPTALLVVEDATEVLRGQRLQAWAEMARIIAHEIKNPLTPIRLSAEHMREVWKRDPEHFGQVVERCTANILTQVDELRRTAGEFSAYSSIPQLAPEPGDLVASLEELVEAYRAAPPEGVSVELEAEEAPLPARFDPRLLHRAVRNLLENAVRASAGGGRVVVRVERQDGLARVAVADSGPGVAPELLQRIFDPYFSTHDTGTGLGLPIARKVAEEHGGTITARNRPEGGLEVAITLPLA